MKKSLISKDKRLKEWMGDAILSVVIKRILIENLASLPMLDLNNLFSHAVSNKSLGLYCERLNLPFRANGIERHIYDLFLEDRHEEFILDFVKFAIKKENLVLAKKEKKINDGYLSYAKVDQYVF